MNSILISSCPYKERLPKEVPFRLRCVLRFASQTLPFRSSQMIFLLSSNFLSIELPWRWMEFLLEWCLKDQESVSWTMSCSPQVTQQTHCSLLPPLSTNASFPSGESWCWHPNSLITSNRAYMVLIKKHFAKWVVFGNKTVVEMDCWDTRAQCVWKWRVAYSIPCPYATLVATHSPKTDYLSPFRTPQKPQALYIERKNRPPQD